jgi:hypothetical protein
MRYEGCTDEPARDRHCRSGVAAPRPYRAARGLAGGLVDLPRIYRTVSMKDRVVAWKYR